MQCSCNTAEWPSSFCARQRKLRPKSLVQLVNPRQTLILRLRCFLLRSSLLPGRRLQPRACKGEVKRVWATGDAEGVLDRWNVSGMVSSNKGTEDQENSLDERESKRVKLDAPNIPQEQIVKVSGFGNRALRSVLKGEQILALPKCQSRSDIVGRSWAILKFLVMVGSFCESDSIQCSICGPDPAKLCAALADEAPALFSRIGLHLGHGEKGNYDQCSCGKSLSQI